MKRFSKLALTAMLCLGVCSMVVAQEADEGSASAEAKKCTSETCSVDAMASTGECKCDELPECKCESKEGCHCKTACDGCSLKSAMASLPTISYMVDGEKVCCSASAAAMAEAKSTEVEYVVGDEKFPTKNEAFVSLVEQTEAAVEEFTTPCKCEASGKTKIAGESCDCPVMAGAMAAKVKSAIQQVSMTYAVGDETCSCPNKAKSMAEAAGTKPAFVVDGEKTDCEMTARLNLARAKFKAAVLATLESDADDSASEG